MAGVLKVRDSGGVSRQITAIKVRTASGLTNVSIGSVRDTGNALRAFFGQIGVTANPTSVGGSANYNGTITVNTNTTTATMTGASNPTYSWAPDANTTGWTISNPSSATTSFSRSVGKNQNFNGNFIVTSQDNNGKTYTATVSANVSNYYGNQ